jgi:hypothetical protein
MAISVVAMMGFQIPNEGNLEAGLTEPRSAHPPPRIEGERARPWVPVNDEEYTSVSSGRI